MTLALGEVWSGQAVRTPNIYSFILDSYPSQTWLQRKYGIDNSEFVEHLEERGFYIAPESHSNFNVSDLSTASTLSMQYVYGMYDAWQAGEEIDRAGPGRERSLEVYAAGRNHTVDGLRDLGYAYIHFETGHSRLTRCRGYEDACIRGPSSTCSM